MKENEKQTDQKVVVTVDEARQMIYSNQISRQTFTKQILRENWPQIRVCKKIFLPYAYVMAKINEINNLGLAGQE